LTASRSAGPRPGEPLTRHAALVAAVKDALPGVIEVQLTNAGDQKWIGMWRWDSLASAHVAVADRGPGRHSRSPEASPRNSPRSAMHDRTRPIRRKEEADPCGRRDRCRWAWPALPLPRLRHGRGQALAAWRGGRVIGPGRSALYEVLVDGVLHDRWADWFGGLRIKSEGTQMVIFGLLPDRPRAR
jgi:hypothetical protein